jgi:integrase
MDKNKRTRGLGRVFRPTYRDKKTGEKKASPTWWIAYSFRGTKHRECSWSSNRQDAVRLLKKRLGEIGRGRFVGALLERTTFDDLEKIIKDDYDANSRRTKGRMLTALTALRQHFGLTLARDITFDNLNAYVVDRLKDGIAPATVRYDLSVLRRALRLAERSGKAICPPFPSIRVNNTRTGFFEEEQFRAVLDHLPEDLRPVVIFAYYTGWRIRSEVLPMQWRQVDLSAGTVRLEPGTTKNDEGRTFPFAMLPELAEVLLEQRRKAYQVQAETNQLVPWVFHRRGQPIKDFYTAWDNACEAAKVPDKIPHDFRRTAVRNLERAGVSRSAAMKLTGHKTESVYRRYAIVSEADLAEGVKKLAALQERKGKARAKQAPKETEEGSTVFPNCAEFGAGARARTGTGLAAQGILSPLRLPFRHSGTTQIHDRMFLRRHDR